MNRIIILFFALFLISEVKAQIKQPCSTCLPEGITFTTQAQIDSFQVNYPGCTQIEGEVTINGEDINNLNGLNRLTYIGEGLFIGTFFYGGNFQLTNLTGLENLTSIGGYLHINQNFVLTSLTGLNNLTSIGDYLVIYGNALDNLSGLSGLTSIGGSLHIDRNNNLTDLSGLENLQTISGDIRISENEALASLTGIENIDATSIGNLTIYDNGSLCACNVQSLCDFLSSPNGVVEVYFNSSGCNTPPEIADACGISLPCLPFGNYRFHTQTEIDSFHSDYNDCSNLNGDVTITSTDINNLNGLLGITTVEGDLSISNNDSLTSLTGLDSLISVGADFYLGVNDSLTDLSGLYSLAYVGNTFWIVNHPSLTSLMGLSGLHSVGKHFIISGDEALNDLDGLAGLHYVGGTLEIGGPYLGNPSLTSLTGLSHLICIKGNLRVHYNNSLTSLSGLDAIDADSLSGVFIDNNMNLSDCAVRSICHYLGIPDNMVVVQDNTGGCNSEAEVAAACEVEIDESSVVSLQSLVILYPNPATDLIFIELPRNASQFQISIFDLNGDEIIKRKASDYHTSMDISVLNAGIYFMKVITDDGVAVGKFVKK
jgi:hypothetical protein